MPSSDEQKSFQAGKKFHHFIRLRVKYLAIFKPDGSMMIVDEDGNNYGSWISIENFRKHHNNHFKRDMIVGKYKTLQLERDYSESQT